MTKILAESLQEYREQNTVNEEAAAPLNEGLTTKMALQRFLKNPKKFPNTFKNVFKNQMSKWKDLAELIDAMEVADKIKWAEKGVKFIEENPSQDTLQLPLVHAAKTGTGKIGIVDVDNEDVDFSGKTIGKREGVHGGTSVKG